MLNMAMIQYDNWMKLEATLEKQANGRKEKRLLSSMVNDTNISPTMKISRIIKTPKPFHLS